MQVAWCIFAVNKELWLLNINVHVTLGSFVLGQVPQLHNGCLGSFCPWSRPSATCHHRSVHCVPLHNETIPPYYSLKAKGCFQKSLNGRLHAKERSWRGLQFGVCGDNIHWRKHQFNRFNFLQLEWSKIFVTLAILYFCLVHVKPFKAINMQERNTM